jgi:hypothetical protein
MFEGSLVESRGLEGTGTGRWTALGSITLQCGLAAVLLAIPMLRPGSIPMVPDAAAGCAGDPEAGDFAGADEDGCNVLHCAECACGSPICGERAALDFHASQRGVGWPDAHNRPESADGDGRARDA